jgi:excisionase family DNA binding protein
MSYVAFFVFVAIVLLVRSPVFDFVIGIDPDQQLTTGEAAKLMNASRQHVVDLCTNGDLPYTTVGRHRRVRRGDIEALRAGTERLTPDQQRSLWLAHAIAGRVVTDPERAVELARRNLDTMRTVARGAASQWLDEWARLLGGPLDVAMAAYTSRDLRGRELRQFNPFAGLLTDAERLAALQAWRRLQANAGRIP